MKNHSKKLTKYAQAIKMYMEARSHNVYSGKQSIILSTNIKFVRIDEDGEPIPIAERVKNKFK